MLGNIIKLGIFLVIGLVGYNYFFGNPEEKEQSRVIVDKAANLGKDAWNLLKSEKSKMDEGKYDGALDKLGALYDNLKETAGKLKDSNALERLDELEKMRQGLEEKVNSTDEATREAAAKEIDQLTEKTEALMKQLDGQ